jgi:hypothetical protein
MPLLFLLLLPERPRKPLALYPLLARMALHLQSRRHDVERVRRKVCQRTADGATDRMADRWELSMEVLPVRAVDVGGAFYELAMES